MTDYRYVPAFLSVSRLGSISKAAEEMNIAQSAVSRQIALFEESLGEDLFFRATRGIELTPRGQILYLKLNETNQWLDNDFAGHKPKIRIGGLEGILKVWLGDRLAQASKGSLPQEISLAIMSGDEVETALTSGHIDIGFSTRKIESERISSRKLYSEKIYVISKDLVDMERLENYCWIGIFKADYLSRLAKRKKPKQFIQAGSLELLLKMVRSGHGIAALAENLIPSTGFKLNQTRLAEEAVYMNLPAYQQVPGYFQNFIDQFCSEK